MLHLFSANVFSWTVYPVYEKYLWGENEYDAVGIYNMDNNSWTFYKIEIRIIYFMT